MFSLIDLFSRLLRALTSNEYECLIAKDKAQISLVVVCLSEYYWIAGVKIVTFGSCLVWFP